MKTPDPKEQPEGKFNWPADEIECRRVGRDLLLREAISHVRYWNDYASDFLNQRRPREPYRRSWSEVAKQDKAYREMFATLNQG
jgi:hypothetical protein